MVHSYTSSNTFLTKWWLVLACLVSELCNLRNLNKIKSRALLVSLHVWKSHISSRASLSGLAIVQSRSSRDPPFPRRTRPDKTYYFSSAVAEEGKLLTSLHSDPFHPVGRSDPRVVRRFRRDTFTAMLMCAALLIAHSGVSDVCVCVP